MKGFYIVMDSVSIHIADGIEQMITKRGCRSIYLPPCSPELNPIENFWSTMKSYVKTSEFSGEEGLKTRVTEARNRVRATALLNMNQHSVNVFDNLVMF